MAMSAIVALTVVTPPYVATPAPIPATTRDTPSVNGANASPTTVVTPPTIDADEPAIFEMRMLLPSSISSSFFLDSASMVSSLMGDQTLRAILSSQAAKTMLLWEIKIKIKIIMINVA